MQEDCPGGVILASVGDVSGIADTRANYSIFQTLSSLWRHKGELKSALSSPNIEAHPVNFFFLETNQVTIDFGLFRLDADSRR